MTLPLSLDGERRVIARFSDYEISEWGGVRRTRTVTASSKGKVLTGTIGPKGYVRYHLRSSGKHVHISAHQLVCEAWHGPRPSLAHEVAHGDGNRLNNHFSNLRWATSAENNADKARHGTISGERHPRARFTWAQVDEMRAIYAAGGISIVEVAQKFEAPYHTVAGVLSGNTYSGVRAL